MHDRSTEFDSFKELFRERLAAFVEKRAGDIGDPGEWRVKQAIVPGNPDNYVNNYIIFHHKSGDGPSISFTLPDVPKNLSAEEGLRLRQDINQICAEAGFKPSKPRLASEIIDGVRKGDPEAWATYVGKHRPRFVENADKLLGNGDNPTLLDGEDFVNWALAEIFQASTKGKIEKPQSIIHRQIVREVNTLVKKLPFKLRKQSGDGDFGRIVQPEYDGRVEALVEQLPAILEKARRLMTPRQRDVIDAVMENEKQGSKLDMQQVAENLNMSNQAFYVHLKKVAKAIQQAANLPGCEETAAIIDGLVRINKRDPASSKSLS